MKLNKIQTECKSIYFYFTAYELNKRGVWNKHTWVNPIEALRYVANNRRNFHYGVLYKTLTIDAA